MRGFAQLSHNIDFLLPFIWAQSHHLALGHLILQRLWCNQKQQACKHFVFCTWSIWEPSLGTDGVKAVEVGLDIGLALLKQNQKKTYIQTVFVPTQPTPGSSSKHSSQLAGLQTGQTASQGGTDPSPEIWQHCAYS